MDNKKNVRKESVKWSNVRMIEIGFWRFFVIQSTVYSHNSICFNEKMRANFIVALTRTHCFRLKEASSEKNEKYEQMLINSKDTRNESIYH